MVWGGGVGGGGADQAGEGRGGRGATSRERVTGRGVRRGRIQSANGDAEARPTSRQSQARVSGRQIVTPSPMDL